MTMQSITRRAALAFAAGGVVLALVAPGALAQSSITGGSGVIETYFAFLGSRDHYNSSGVRLTQPWQIIRQDRANYHRFKVRDDGDEWDSFFGSASNRARMEAMLMKGSISPSAANAIVNRQVWVKVEVLGHGSTGTAVRVSVQ